MYGQWNNGWFDYTTRVYLEDVDAGGVVYHANYLKYAERARTEMVAAAGVRHAAIMAEGPLIVVRALKADYLSPLRLEEELTVRSRLLRLGGASATLEQVIESGGVKRAVLEVVLVYLDAAGRPARWPESLKPAFGPVSHGCDETTRI